MIRIFIVCHFWAAYVWCVTQTLTYAHTHTHTRTFHAYSLAGGWPFFCTCHHRLNIYTVTARTNEPTRRTKNGSKREMPLRTLDIFLAHFHFTRFHSPLYLCAPYFFDLRLFYTFFLRSRALLKSQKRRRREKELDRLHCINERKYAHLDERREYLNDSGFLPPLPMRNEALQMNYHHFYVTQYVCVRVSVCMSSEDQNASFESWKLRTEREGERGKGIVVNLQHNTNIVFVRILSFRIHSFSVYSFFLFRLTEIITDHGKEWTHTHTHRGKKEQKSNEKWKEEGVMNG